MAKLFYLARDKKGQKVSGFDDTSNEDELVSRLQASDLVVVDIKSEKKDNLEGLTTLSITRKRAIRHYGISSSDLVLFCRQFATLLGSGITILNSLEIISKQVASRKLFDVLKSLQKYMEQGLSLHEAMEKYPQVFSNLWANLVESGEASGNLATILDRLATHLEKIADFKRRVISALIYPAVLFVAGISALLFLTLKIIPTFAELLGGFNVQLPKLTLFLIAVSTIIRRFGILILGAVFFFVFLFKKYIKTKDGRRQYETFLFKLPVFGDFFRGLIIERFSSEMATLVESGVPILYSLEITEKSVGNLIMGEMISRIKEEVRQGRPLSVPLERSGFFEPMVIQMVAIGEEIGELSQMFKKINSFYQVYVETFLIRMTTLFEPIMLVFMGFIIGIIVIGMFLPIFKIAQIGG